MLFRNSGRGAAPAAAYRRQGHRNKVASPGHAVQTPSGAQEYVSHFVARANLGFPHPCSQSFQAAQPSSESFQNSQADQATAADEAAVPTDEKDLSSEVAEHCGRVESVRGTHMSAFTLPAISVGHEVRGPSSRST